MYTKLKSITLTGLIGLFCLMTFNACETIPEIKWNYSDQEVLGSQSVKTEEIDLDIYLDATTSMEGYAVAVNTNYGNFLDQLEASSFSVWKKSRVNYYKFGEKVRQVERNDFLSAKDSKAFYREPGIFKTTYIDSVIKRTNTSKLTILITDLFQNEGDVNSMVDRIKEVCFSAGVMVGIAGIKSEYSGKVFDTPAYPQGYPLVTEERPFYAIMFGAPGNMELFFESLKAQRFVDEKNFLLFSPYIVKEFQLDLKKEKTTKATKLAKHKEMKNVFDFNLKPDVKEAEFSLDIKLTQNPRCAKFNPEALEVVIIRKSITGDDGKKCDSVRSEDITLSDVKMEGDVLKAKVKLQNDYDQEANFSYLVYIRAHPLKGLITPEWISEFSTTEPVVNTPTANLTYNLEPFINRLLVANSSITATNLAKFYINIYKY